eukprot:gnl/TRDRNA2_/TRDRNA2_174904_c2_seq1.p1 gnl/TRDRNA2_/TRDRNA2_174904_c2~~gnl/TRDRNA2_/TRDRNA2_174904_c2_seq1.p1  ORF type:complete len:113 (+),score=26.57 gnl/TRDRNA2_/TRDRNA2_174904_c2_seq1:3-341(+)
MDPVRPVSFSFRAGTDSKSMNNRPRYGFVAQEVEKVLPHVVRNLEDTKFMVYQDLIAMITLAAQDHQDRLQRNHGEVGKLKDLMQQLASKLTSLQSRVTGIFEAAGKAAKVV